MKRGKRTRRNNNRTKRRLGGGSQEIKKRIMEQRSKRRKGLEGLNPGDHLRILLSNSGKRNASIHEWGRSGRSGNLSIPLYEHPLFGDSPLSSRNSRLHSGLSGYGILYNQPSQGVRRGYGKRILPFQNPSMENVVPLIPHPPSERPTFQEGRPIRRVYTATAI